MDRISIVVPCFNEEEALPVYYREMKRVMGELSEVSFEILFVDDGSSDKTLEILKQLNAKDGRCEYLSFSRNFGKEAAIYAGLKHASGDYVATMDVDLQDPPGLLPEMYRILKEEPYDSVATRRATRTGEPKIRSFLSETFYKFINSISKTEIVNGARDYRLMNFRLGRIPYKMAGIPKRGAFGRRNKMVSSETIFLFAGRNYRIFSSTFVSGICYGSRVLRVGIYYDCSNHSTNINLGRSGCRLAVNGMYYLFGERGSTVLSWNRGRVSG